MHPPQPDPDAIREALLAWYPAAARDLPWRRRPDPWATWVSEVMLQQTRVETVIPYFERFVARFPTARALASAPEPEVLALWSGLGYYRRARLLHAGARRVVEAHGAEVPATWEALRALPGVGDYTAGAIGSIAFGLRVPLVDGNVERVLTRAFGLRGDPRAAPLKKTLWALAARLADHPAPGDVNQSLMELGATVCAPTSPRCLVCPLRASCVARREGDPARYPEKPPREAPKVERWHGLVATWEGRAWLVPSAMDRWRAMLVPPLARAEGRAAPAWDVPLAALTRAGRVTHVLTHARMEVTVHRAALTAPPSHGTLVDPDALEGHAVPKITRRVLACALSPQRARSR